MTRDVVEPGAGQVEVTTWGKRFDEMGRHVGPGDWLTLIHEVNRIQADTFGEPLSVGQQEGRGYVEEYEDAAVVMVDAGDDMLVTVRSKTETGAHLIRQAAEKLGMNYFEDGTR